MASILAVGRLGKLPGIRRLDAQPRLILATAGFLLLTSNVRFFREAARAYSVSEHLGFLLALFIVAGCALVVSLTVLSNRLTVKPLLAVALLIAAPAGYFADRLGTIFDTTMLINVLESNVKESSELLTPGLWVRMLFLGFLPALGVAAAPLRRRPWRVELGAKAKLLVVTLLLLVAAIAPFGAPFAGFLREHKSIRQYVNPVYPIYSLVKLAVSSPVRESVALRTLYPDARLPPADPHRELMLLVVGETARADHFSIYGYSRDTTPVLGSTAGLFVFRDVSACGTSTSVSVPCMFGAARRTEFRRDEAAETENLLDILQRVGVRVLWRDNNTGSKGVADRVLYEDFSRRERNPNCDSECRDVGMLAGLQEFIDRQAGDVLIVLHQMGSHGPAYHRRVPAEFAVFEPACRTDDLTSCTSEEIINAYDNTIRYTDVFLGKVLELLRANQTRFEAALLYVSDHGESLGEGGIYLHGMPFSLAPRAQTQVPMVLWVGGHNDIDELALEKVIQRSVSHDILFQTLLRFYEVEGVLPGDKEPAAITLDEE